MADDQQTVAVPQGAVFSQQAPPSAETVPVPQGASFAPQQGTQPQQSNLQKVGSAALGFAKGVGEGALQTGNTMVHGLDYVQNKVGNMLGIGEANGLPAPEVHLQDMFSGGAAPGTPSGAQISEKLATPTTTSEKVGVAAESIAEFVLGDEALKGLSMGEKALKAAQLAEKYEKATPFVKAGMTAVMNAGRGAVVGGVQGALHGEDAKAAVTQGLLTGGVSLTGAAISGALKAGTDLLSTPEVQKYASDVTMKLMQKAINAIGADGSQGTPAAIDAAKKVLGSGFVDWFNNASEHEMETEVVQKVAQSPAALNQFVKDVASHLPAAAAKTAIGYAIYKSPLPNVIKEAAIIGLGLHEVHSLGGILGTPEAQMLAGRASQVVAPAVAPLTTAAQAGVVAMQPTVPTQQPEEEQQ